MPRFSLTKCAVYAYGIQDDPVSLFTKLIYFFCMSAPLEIIDRNQNLTGINLNSTHIGTKVSEHSKRPAVISKHYWGIKALVLIKMRKCHGRVLGS